MMIYCARFPLPNPLERQLAIRLSPRAGKSLVIPQAGEGANEALREFHSNWEQIMMKAIRCIQILLAVLLLSPLAQAAETGVAIKADELKAEPFRDAKSVGTLAAGDQVDIVKRNDGWLNVKSAKGKGWVRMLSIRRGGAPAKSTAGASGLAGLASGRAGTGKVVATTGIRGLNEEQLKAAKYDEAEVKLVESYSVGRAEAQKFADKGKLKAQKVDYLPGEAK